MVKTTGWIYYNHAFLPDVQPHETADASEVTSGEIWNGAPKGAILARWTSDFDCGYPTEWWYIIKDTPFDINSLKSKRRYRINHGLRNFRVTPMDPRQYTEELFRVQSAAYGSYPKKYRPHHTLDEMAASVAAWAEETDCTVFGAFSTETDALCGYAVVTKRGACLDFSVLKVDPAAEKLSVNQAVLASVLEYYGELLENGHYICNGARNVSHETNFQAFVEETFGYRKAYCRLHVAYNPKYRRLIKFLYVLRKPLAALDGIRAVHKINGVLKMERIVRMQNEEKDGDKK